ncbi:hypothetical protein GCM10008968_43130 [Bacillus horti]
MNGQNKAKNDRINSGIIVTIYLRSEHHGLGGIITKSDQLHGGAFARKNNC